MVFSVMELCERVMLVGAWLAVLVDHGVAVHVVDQSATVSVSG